MIEGSKMIWTDSAWPVVPIATCSYVGFSFRPPEKPDLTDKIPFTLLKTASVHQKQPFANVAVCS